MGVLKNITDEYFGYTKREEDFPDITELDVEIVSFTDNNGKFHKSGYRVVRNRKTIGKMPEILSRLIEIVIEKHGVMCDLNFIDVSNMHSMCTTVGRRKKAYESIFHNVYEFNGDISGWDVSNVEYMDSMFQGTKFDGDISKWDVSNVRTMSYMFDNSYFTGNNGIFRLEKGNKLEDTRFMFNQSKFGQDISDWDMSNVKFTDFMFNGCPIESNPPEWYSDKTKYGI